MYHFFIKPFILTLIATTLLACGQGRRPAVTDQNHDAPPIAVRAIPEFNKDSAFYFIERQVLFGPRIPNTQTHRAAGDWLISTLNRFADTVYVQETRVRAYNGDILNIRNIIGVFQPENRNRVLLCAHWDSRPWADHDPNPAYHYTPIDGANDGASGVGVLLEIARLLRDHGPNVGVDIIFFDAEDYGHHNLSPGHDTYAWGLGSQFWARNPHRADYTARYGILLDMLGMSNATFKLEGFSMMYAPDVKRRVWSTAQRLGFGHHFVNVEGGHIIHDHYFVNTIRHIPTINIIDLSDETDHGFFKYWHTMKDNMEAIDPYTLYAAGKTVTTVIFEEE